MRHILSAFIIFLGLAVVAPGAMAQEEALCLKEKPYESEITIDMQTPEAEFDLTESMGTLMNPEYDSIRKWIKKNNMQEMWSSRHLQKEGQAGSGWAVTYDFTLDAHPLDSYKAYSCLYVKDIHINMMYRTLAFIPKEYAEGGCVFNKVKDHELKHFEIGKTLAHKTTARLRTDMPEIIAGIEAEYVGSDKTKEHAEKVKKSIADVVDIYFMQVMKEEADKLHSQVDSPEEYKNMSMIIRNCSAAYRYRTPKAP